jgi:G6PDH family F420-dependent oxidoreductase
VTRFGIKLMVELRGPAELVDQAVEAEQRGLDFAAISDHIHPWLGDHEHSPFAWSVLGAIASRTERIGIATGVTCPIIRYHPAIVAQAAATIGTLSDGRFTLALGAGERLNEHVVGQGWPPVYVRHEMLADAVEIIRALHGGGFVTHRGTHLSVEDARVYDVPDEPVPIVLAVSGPQSLDLARDCGADGIMAIDPDEGLVDGWAERGGDRSATWTEVGFAVAPSADEGRALAHERMRFVTPGWKVMAELPNPVNFDAATALVTPEQVGEMVPHGPDPEPYVEAVQEFVDAGFENISFVPIGDDLPAFFDMVEQVRDRLG